MRGLFDDEMVHVGLASKMSGHCWPQLIQVGFGFKIAKIVLVQVGLN
jgi:hypothetical protein